MIKKWNQFIVEKQLQIFKGTSDEYPELEYRHYYPISEEDIKDYLLEIEDAGYDINVNYGFIDAEDTHYHKRSGDNKIFFTEYVKSISNTPLIEILISTTDRTGNDDVTSCLKSFIRRIKHLFDKVIIRDDNGELDINYIEIKGGMLTDSLEVEGDLVIQCIWKEEIHFSHKMIFENLNIVIDKDVHFDKRGQCTFDISREILAKHLVNREYQDILSDDEIEYDRWFDDTHYFIPEHYDLFTYHLDDSNIKLLLSYCFRNYDSIRSEYGDEYEFLNDFESTEDFVNRFHESVNYKELGNFLDNINDDTYQEIRQDYAQMYVDNKVDSDIEAIYEAFNKLVKDDIGHINKIFRKEIVKKDKNGHDVSYQKVYYNIDFDASWAFDYDDYDDRRIHIDDLILHYIDNHLCQSELKPYFKDYADVDNKEFNEHVKSNILYLMKKNT